MPTIGHNLDCRSNFARADFDSICPRCVKIKHVIALRRKTVEYGASAEEQLAAMQVAQHLVDQYGLTRGEVLDRQYAQQIVRIETQQFTERKKRRRGAPVEIF